jgi:hypothetical protein
MKSLKFIVRLALFVMVLFAVAVSTHAQECPGYNPTIYQSPNPGTTSAYNPPEPCAGQSIFSTASFSQTSSTTDYCGTLQTGGVLTNPSTVTGNGVASCTPVVVYCYPHFDLEVTVATNQQDYNRFYNRAYDYTYSSSPSGCVPIATPSPSRQDFWQCAWYSCPPPPGSGGSGACGGERKQAPGCTSPIIFDIDGKGFNLTSAEGGVLFDMSGTGNPIQMGWTAKGAGNAFLALPGPDGLVHNGKELFGNFTPQPASDSPNGFAALAVYDDPKNGGNGDGIIDSHDAIYSSLRLWIDNNHDGISQTEELHTLASLGVTSISLQYSLSERVDQYGNYFRYKAPVDPDEPNPDHVGRKAYDVFFVTLPTGTTKNLMPLKPGNVKQCPVVPDTKGWMPSTNATLR